MGLVMIQTTPAIDYRKNSGLVYDLGPTYLLYQIKQGGSASDRRITTCIYFVFLPICLGFD